MAANCQLLDSSEGHFVSNNADICKQGSFLPGEMLLSLSLTFGQPTPSSEGAIEWQPVVGCWTGQKGISFQTTQIFAA